MSKYHKSCIVVGILLFCYSIDFAAPGKSAASVGAVPSNRSSGGELAVFKEYAATSDSTQLLTGPASSETTDSRTDRNEPALSVVIFKSLITQMTQRTIDQQLPLEDLIMGTKIVGTSHLVGRPEIHLLPDANGWKFEFLLNGTVESQTVGSQNYVRIHSRSSTEFQARKCIRISPEGIQEQPCVSTAQTHSVTTAIVPKSSGTRGTIVKSIATRRVDESRPAADQIASHHAETRINDEIDRRFQKVARLLRPIFAVGHFATNLAHRGSLRPSMHTTPDYLWLELNPQSVNPMHALSAENASQSGLQVQVRSSLLTSLFRSAAWIMPTRHLVEVTNPGLPVTRKPWEQFLAIRVSGAMLNLNWNSQPILPPNHLVGPAR